MTRFLAALAATGIALAPAFSAPPGNPYNQRLEHLDAVRRGAVIRRAIIDSGMRCGRVDSSGRTAPYKNLLGWSAHCSPGGDYVFFVGPDGSAQVRTCMDARMLNLPGCPALKKP